MKCSECGAEMSFEELRARIKEEYGGGWVLVGFKYDEHYECECGHEEKVR